MSIPHGLSDRSREHLLARIWACVNGVEVHNFDDLHRPGDTYELGDVFMSEKDWTAFRDWQEEEYLRSGDAIKSRLQASDFIPADPSEDEPF